MKILMVTMSLGIGGAETHILELARELRRRGHRVTVASGGGIFVDLLARDGVHHVCIPMQSKRPDRLLCARRALDALIREEKPDVIHAHARIPGFIASPLARRYDIPFVTTFHGTFNPVWYLRMLTRVGQRSLAVSEDVRQYLMRYYRMPREKIALTVNGIDTQSFRPDGPRTDGILPPPPGQERILTVTRLDREAAWHVYRLIEAMPEILAARPQAYLDIIGGGDVLDEIRTLAEEQNRAMGEDRIRVLGPHRDIAALLGGTDVFVGVSRAAMEAMACQIPVVLSGAQGHLGVYTPAMEADAVDTNFCGRGRDVADAATLASAVITVLSASPEEKRKMGEDNREIIGRLYSVARMADDAQELYEQALREYEYRRTDVLISGYYGFSNAGDDALLASITQGLRARGIRRTAALSRRGTCPAPGVRGVNRFNLLSVRREIRRAKLLISGGGSLLQDATSSRSLLYYTAVIRMAHRAGVPVMIFANGIGPLAGEANRRRARRAVLAADYVSVRENASAEELVRMGIPREKIRVTADPVYRSSTCGERTPGEYVVLSLRETADRADTRRMEDAAVAALREICRTWGLDAVLLPMQPMYDQGICGRVAARLTESGVAASVVPSGDEESVRACIGGARLVVGMRLHALIFATAAGVPSLALSYDPKIDALMAYLGMEEYVLPAFTATEEELTESLRRLLREEAAVSDRLQARVLQLAALAEEDLKYAAALCGEGGVSAQKEDTSCGN